MLFIFNKLLLVVSTLTVVTMLDQLPIVNAGGTPIEPPNIEASSSSSTFSERRSRFILDPPSDWQGDSSDSTKSEKTSALQIVGPSKCTKYTSVDITDTNAVDTANNKAPTACKTEKDVCFRILARKNHTDMIYATAGCMSEAEHNATNRDMTQKLENGFGCINDDANNYFNMIPEKSSEYSSIDGDVKQLCVNVPTDVESQKLRVVSETHECYEYHDVDYRQLNGGLNLSTTKCFTTFRDIYAKGSKVETMCYWGTRTADDGVIKYYGGCVHENKSCKELDISLWPGRELTEKFPNASFVPKSIRCCEGKLCNMDIELVRNISCSMYTAVNIFNVTAVKEINDNLTNNQCHDAKFCYKYIEEKDDVLYATAGCQTNAFKYPTALMDELGCYTEEKARGAAATALGLDMEKTTTICTGINETNMFSIDGQKLPTCYSYNVEVADGSATSIPRDVKCYTSYGEREKKVEDTKHYCYYTLAVGENGKIFYTGGCIDKPKRCEAAGDDGINMTTTEKGRIDWFLEILKFKEDRPRSKVPVVIYCCATTLGGEPCNDQLVVPPPSSTQGSTKSTVSLALFSVVIVILARL